MQSTAHHVITLIFQTCLIPNLLLEATPEGQFLPDLPATALQILCSVAGRPVLINIYNQHLLQLKEGYDNVLAKSQSCFFLLSNITQFERQFGVYKQLKSSNKCHTWLSCEYITLGANLFFQRDHWSPHVDQVCAGLSASSIAVC